ncbi:hypothetical protein BT63DRAFT_233432 [Microthyrium microscopicum]|uniref:SP-RING-type domain-containing protein n=1 Tax=Microthyrium microscopicum TaxID=703497 RepID=A0A6A6UDP0_9PEZI|nr:hypothetical protein BT63DRAFT_233432 [Microthyrium microscopicum]
MPPGRPSGASRGRPSGAQAMSNSTPAPYQPLAFPLSSQGKTSLMQMSQRSKLQDVDKLLNDAIKTLTECGKDLVEIRATRTAEDEDDEFDESAKEATKSIEQHVRALIDGRQDILNMQYALVQAQRGSVQQLRNQTQTQRLRAGQDEDEEMMGTDVTVAGASQNAQVTGPSRIFQDSVDDKQDQYDKLSLGLRYSEHPDYVGFKQELWDAQHAATDDANPPLPHRTTWFTDRGSPDLHSDNEGDEDEIQVTSGKLSTVCPLSRGELVKPVRSHDCVHVFEKAAIEEYIRQNAGSVQCPIPGCHTMLVVDQLFEDEALTKKIRRIQEGRQKSGAEEEDTQMEMDGDRNRDFDDIEDDEQEDEEGEEDDEEEEEEEEDEVEEPVRRGSTRMRNR